MGPQMTINMDVPCQSRRGKLTAIHVDLFIGNGFLRKLYKIVGGGINLRTKRNNAV